MNNYYHIDLGKHGNFSSVLDMNFGKQRKYTIGNGPYTSLNGPTQNFNFKGTWDLDENRSLTLGAGYYNSDFTATWGSLGDAILETERYDYNLGYDGKTDKSNHSFYVYYSKLNKDRYLPYQKWMGEGMEKNKYSLFGIEAKNTVQANDQHLLTYGINYDNNKVEGANFGSSTTGVTDETTTTYAGYLQDEWMINDKLLLIPAVRYDHHSDFGSKTTPKIGATYFMSDNSRFKVNWGKGFKAPTVSQLYMDYTHMGELTVGNPDLEPEESTNYDISFEAEGNGTFGKLTYFNNKIDNMISTRSVGSGRDAYNEYYNIDGTTKTHGVELSLGHDLNDLWTVKTTSNWTSASNNEGGSSSSGHGVDGIADNVTTLQLIYDDKKEKGFSATLWNEWVKDYYESDSGKEYTYSTLNVVFNKKLGNGSRVFAGLDNILNEKEHDINLDGRIWRVGAEWTF